LDTGLGGAGLVTSGISLGGAGLRGLVGVLGSFDVTTSLVVFFVAVFDLYKITYTRENIIK
jgi:hypothetical protein